MVEPTTGVSTGRLTIFELLAPTPASTAPPILGVVLPVIAGVLLMVEGALIEGLLMTGADGTIGAATALPVTGAAMPVVRGVVPGADGVVPTGEGVLPLIEGAAPETPPADVPLVCARAGKASMAAAAMRQVRANMEVASLCRSRVRSRRSKPDAAWLRLPRV
jgi:hypothetical protein